LGFLRHGAGDEPVGPSFPMFRPCNADSCCRMACSATDSEYIGNRVGPGTGDMKLYRIDKLARLGGMVIKKKHILAQSDRQAVAEAEASEDCPICDVIRDGEKVGQVV
jgi:hypothetical protein